MKCRVAEGGAFADGRPPRVAVVVAHPGLRGDLTRAFAAMGWEAEAREGLHDLQAGSRAQRSEDLRFDAYVIDRAGGAAEAEADAGRIVRELEAPVVWLAGSPHELLPPLGPRSTLLFKPFSVADLEEALQAALEAASDHQEGMLDPILRTRDPALEKTLARARRLAGQDVPIAIEGELGVGRRALASAVHAWSARGTEPLCVLDRTELATAPPDAAAARIDSTLGSVAAGSLVLVEPAEWSSAAQSALAHRLRAASRPVRCLSIVSESLESSMDRGRLLAELGDRLDVARVLLPPLRARIADARGLCEAVARSVARQLGRVTPDLDDAMIAAWVDEGFPGNRLGLESRIRNALLREEVASTAASPLEVERHEAEERSLDLKALERDTIVRALAHWKGNRTRASESLGISVRTLRNKIRDYGLR